MASFKFLSRRNKMLPLTSRNRAGRWSCPDRLGIPKITRLYGALFRRQPHRAAGLDVKGVVKFLHVEQRTKGAELARANAGPP